MCPSVYDNKKALLFQVNKSPLCEGFVGLSFFYASAKNDKKCKNGMQSESEQRENEFGDISIPPKKYRYT